MPSLQTAIGLALFAVSVSSIYFFLSSRGPRVTGQPQRNTNARPAIEINQNPQEITSHHPESIRDICETIFLLRQRLIPDLIPGILDHAGYWVRAASIKVTEHRNYNQFNAGRVYAMLGIPEKVALGGVRKLVFSITSKDQGWSSDEGQYYGTYENSWTWFEAVVFEPDAYEFARVTVPGRRIITNIHAGRNMKNHVVEWTYNSKNEEIRDVLSNLKGGQRVAITAWALYPGWVNKVESAQIDIYTPKVRRG